MRILCAVDGSECSRWGVQALEALADREPDDVTFLHVVDPSALRVGRERNLVTEQRALAAMDRAGDILLREAERSARVALGQAATGSSTMLHHVLAHGPIAQTIVRQARRVKAVINSCTICRILPMSRSTLILPRLLMNAIISFLITHMTDCRPIHTKMG